AGVVQRGQRATRPKGCSAEAISNLGRRQALGPGRVREHAQDAQREDPRLQAGDHLAEGWVGGGGNDQCRVLSHGSVSATSSNAVRVSAPLVGQTPALFQSAPSLMGLMVREPAME